MAVYGVRSIRTLHILPFLVARNPALALSKKVVLQLLLAATLPSLRLSLVNCSNRAPLRASFCSLSGTSLILDASIWSNSIRSDGSPKGDSKLPTVTVPSLPPAIHRLESSSYNSFIPSHISIVKPQTPTSSSSTIFLAHVDTIDRLSPCQPKF